MAYLIRGLRKENIKSMEEELRETLHRSRFDLPSMEILPRGRNRKRLEIRHIRLREKKDYCGNHPGPCRVTGRKHKHFRFLEGADLGGF